MRNIAIIGSSGGNLYHLGGKEPQKLLEELLTQLSAAGLNLAAIQFIAAEESMDSIKPTTKAKIFQMDGNGESIAAFTGLLAEMNKKATKLDEEIAKKVYDEKIDGIIIMSGDPERSNRLAMEAAVEKKIPIVGTGGTSMAIISAKGANVVSVSGTTGTTNRTRAISFITSLCKFWGMKYKPIIGTSKESFSVEQGNVWRKINFRGIMVSALPGFIAMALVLALSKIPTLSGLTEIFNIMIQALPVIVAVIAAKQVSDLEEVSIVAGVVAGVLSVNGGIIGGIIAGILAGVIVQFFFRKCLEWRFPMTTVNIVAGGFSGLLAGLVVYFIVAPIALKVGDAFKAVIEMAINFNPIMAGLIAGLLIWPAILGGIYHAAILPIVLLEMERTGASFLGAIDMVGLVIVSAGINLANMIAPRDKGEAAAATPGFLINMGFGTFVEAAYPFMFSNKIVFGGAIFSAGVGGALVGLFNVRGTAYVPTFTAPLLASNSIGFVIAMVVTLALAFTITLIANKMAGLEKKEPNLVVEERKKITKAE